jgi:flagellar basal body-associated protein FliL
MNFPERSFTPVAKHPSRKRRRWIAVIMAGVLLAGAVGIWAFWYLRVCGNCGPILCDDPCTLPTFSQVAEPGLSGA